MLSLEQQSSTLTRLRDSQNTYKCYDSIPTPSPIAQDNSDDNDSGSLQKRKSSQFPRPASLDSLVNSIEHDSSSDDGICDSDSSPEREKITGTTTVQVHEKGSLDDVMEKLVIPREPVIRAYLEKASQLQGNEAASVHSMDEFFLQSSLKRHKNEFQEDHEDPIAFVPTSNEINLSLSPTNASASTVAKNRRSSITSSGSVGRMETILEEPIEAKVSVKEILARFETLRESAEVHSKTSTLSSGARAAAATLNANQTERHNNQETAVGRQTNAQVIAPSRPSEDYEGTGHHQSVHQGRKSSSPGHHKTSINHQDVVMQQQKQLRVDESIPLNAGPTGSSKYSLLQFAAQHFRHEAPNDEAKIAPMPTRGDKRSTGSSRPQLDLVRWQGNPLKTPLLRLPSDLAMLALECFECILRYCGDLPSDPDLTEVQCVYTILMHCHKHLTLRDEVYCQLMKQTTVNRSPNPESVQRAWRLLSILAAYFGCSDALRPYLMEHLSVAASDRRRSCHGTAAVCLTNLRKTARCGGRKNVPSVEEVTAVSAGRSARRQIYRLPGGAERVVNTRCSTVVADVIAELCSLLGIDSGGEQQEFSLYCIVQGDAFTMPLAADEYILDVTTELLKSGQPFYLIFCRSVWHFPLKRDPAPTPLYVEVLFNQVAPDYLEGLLLELPAGGAPPPDVVRDMARVAALLHRAADLSHVPAMKEIKFLLPKPALGIRELRPAQWVALVQSAWPSVAPLSPGQVKAQFLAVLATWPLFGSSFFAVKRVWADDVGQLEDSSSIWRELILALNRKGVLFLDPNSHEPLQHWPFTEVISTRKVRSEDGALFLDMKVGNLMQQRVIRVQTEQAHEISRLVRQYITMAQVQQRDRRE